MKRNDTMRCAALAVTAVLLAGAATLASCSREKNYLSIMAVTGATPIALKEEVKGGTALKVTGLTKKVYTFDEDALNAFAPVYIRTREVDARGKFLGTYRYAGIPLVHILEGIAPKKPKDAAFDKPLDMIVTFVGEGGKKVHFSYGELTMGDDALPVTLAFDRKELLPNEKKGEYKFNINKGNIDGLRLICPAEPDTARYLDGVKQIILREVKVPEGLPRMKKGTKCSSERILGRWKDQTFGIAMAGVPRERIEAWVRTGHGKGFKGVSSAEGYNLAALLRRNFPGCGKDTWFLFVACDGYRATFSGREIFLTGPGGKIMLVDRLDGRAPFGGWMLGPVKDYFVDRDLWGLSHIVALDSVE